MPLYDLKCVNGHYTEEFLKISESGSPQVCAVCGAVARRIISPVAGVVKVDPQLRGEGLQRRSGTSRKHPNDKS
tara:strand:- start:1216 stop:1437 length:222 start_codon:yes stop_codon:yes gene_type:complete